MSPAALHFPSDLRWQSAALVLLILFSYANSLGSGFHFDDAAIFADPYIMDSGAGWQLFRLQQTRPLTYLTFHWNHLLGGTDPTFYHVVNLSLHLANSVLLLALARRYLSPLPAFCAAIVFALHPIETESVTYVFSRSTLLSTHFALWALMLYERQRYRLSALSFGVSLLAKEEAIALPVLLLLFDLFERRRPRLGYYAALAGFAGLAAARLFYLIYTSPVAPGIGRVTGISIKTYLLTECRVLWLYLRVIIAPFDLNLDRDVSLSTSLFSPWTTLPAILALTIVVAGLLWLAWHKRRSALWALGFFILIAPSSSIVPQADVIFEHRTYLPMICAVLALGFLLQRVPRLALTISFGILTPAMMLATVSRNADWHDEQSLWTDIAAKSPNKARSWLGLARLYRGDPVKGREYLIKGLSLDPDNADLRTDLGNSLLAQRQPAEALAQFQRAMSLTGENADRWNNIGAAYFEMNNGGMAMESFQRALRFDPCSFNARRNVMMFYSQRNDPASVWQSGAIPPACRMVPDQANELETLRRQAGQPPAH